MKVFIIVLFFAALKISDQIKAPSSFSEQFIVWNVGQGQMTTYVSKSHCYHFDMGGEKKYFPEKKLFQVCHNKKNRVHYSHWDCDHINFSSKVKRIFPSLCRNSKELPTKGGCRIRGRYTKKQRIISSVPECKTSSPIAIQEIKLSPKARPRNSNESSRIFVVKEKILIPGDSTARMEKYWSSNKSMSSIKVLVVGHHGSRSSTSRLLLNRLPALQLAISSARRKRYGHPHPRTVERLRNKGVVFISTEDFGPIRIPLQSLILKALPF